MCNKALFSFSLFLLTIFASHSQAAISLGATRVIFDAKHQESSLSVLNQGGEDVLVQSWLESDTADFNISSFAVTPPLSRLAKEGRQQLRILYSGEGVPLDRESVAWLNVQEIPQKVNGESVLQLAVRQRIKMFFRPSGLPGSAAEAPAQLKWTLNKQGQTAVLKVENPSRFHVSLTGLSLKGANYKDFLMAEGRMLAPGASVDILVNPMTSAASLKLDFKVINDYGGQNAYAVDLHIDKVSSATPYTLADK
ncbi:Pili assembly chaperone [Pseudomonas synxantha]|uniref:fimbrial biogenesis chaperone n=1 Tax=Pseudomonas synxantha TaxID=47883 RepID=UPI000F7080C4|nr:molecular chaperone [Pseudomonas synxantha]AZE72382.1 Pili assembly chaperone [Pseudomonas synxantha]AZE78051.1 Pili assembly chaperone [Pseudomonas synxantha]